MASKTVPAGEFKQGCLALLDEVAEKHVELVITKRGKPVARLVPMQTDKQKEEAILAKLRSAGAKILVSEEELLKPIDVEWDAEK